MSGDPNFRNPNPHPHPDQGFLSGSFKVAMHEALSLRLSGKADLNQKQRPTAGLQFFYDLD